MTKNLVVVESPAKAKTIEKYLGAGYRVLASIGHIKDLPSKGLGVDVENNFQPTYEVIPDAKKRNNRKIVSALKAAAKEAEAIYLAADPDREGEAICQHLKEEIVPKRPAKPAFRVMFNEITKRAVNDAFDHPREIEQIVKTEYWTIAANLNAKLPPAFDARLLKVDEQTVKTSGFDQDLKKNEILIGDEAQAQEL